MDSGGDRWDTAPAVLGSIWRYRVLVVAVILALGLAGFAWSSQQSPVYQTEARIFLTDPSTTNVFGQSRGTDLERYVPQQAERLTSSEVLAASAAELDDGTSSEELRGLVEVDHDVALGMLSVQVRDRDPVRAATVANTMVDTYQRDVRSFQVGRAERAAAELLTAVDDIEEQIDALSAEVDPVDGEDPAIQGQVDVLVQRLLELESLSQQLRVDARLFGSGVEFVEEATVPLAPVAPTPVRTTVTSAALGAVLAAALAYWLAGRGRRILQRDEPAEILGVPLLGLLPTYRVERFSSLRDRARLDPRTAEAYRFVHTSLAQVLRESDARSVLITSASPAAGKSETALQLAITSADRGSNVLLIDADVRSRGLTRFLRADRTEGLLDLADAGAAAPNDLITRYRIRDGLDLAVLTAGATVDDGPTPVQESWFGRVFPELVAGFDLTVVDSPPLLAVADTATLAAYSDAVVLVVREGSDVDELVRVQQRMRFVGKGLVGYVYLSPHALDSSDLDYGLVRAQAQRSVRRTDAPTGPDPQGGRPSGAGPTPLPPLPGGAPATSRPTAPRRRRPVPDLRRLFRPR